ncbi:MAG: polyamine ABC transporter substrate-binding protein [Aestuariivirga sp.]
MSTFRPKFRPSRRSLLKGASAFAMGLTISPRFSMGQEEEKSLNLYNYDTYIGETTLDDFEAATGIKPKMDLFADMDELFSKLKAGNPGYDAIVVSNDYLERMVKANMVTPLDHAKIPNMANIDPDFINPTFDPGRKHSIPYQWGTIGIGYRKSAMGGAAVDSWKILLDSDAFSGKISLLGDAQNVIGCALKYLGYSFNATDPAELKKAEDLLIAQKKHIKVFADDNGQDLLASGEVVATQEWSGDIAQVMVEDPDLDYSVPTEGSNIWEDTWAIPVGAPHPGNAHAFLNFVLDAENGKKITETIQYATPNLAARKLMPPEHLNNRAIYPPAEVLAKCEPTIYLGEEATKVKDELWTRVQAA